MSVTQKIIWTLGLISVFLLILITGRSNIRNFEQIQASIEEIYKDRLVVKGLIFDLSSLVHRKEIANLTDDKNFYDLENETVNTEIENHVAAFRDTKLTPYEELTLNHFSKIIGKLKENEKKFAPSSQNKLLKAQIKTLKEDLITLANIQLLEGKKKLHSSDGAVESMNTFAIFENYILVIFGILMLVIIFVVPNEKRED